MARPDIKDGFARVPNELISVLCKVNLSAWEWRILWAVIRFSWSWGRLGCYTSYRELASKTRLDLRGLSKTLRGLVAKQILITRNGSKKTWVEINTDYELWRLPEGESLFTNSAQNDAPPSVVSGHNTRHDKALCVGTTPGVVSGHNTRTPETYTDSQFRDDLKNYIKKLE